jgi:hypothetical protein
VRDKDGNWVPRKKYDDLQDLCEELMQKQEVCNVCQH